MPRHTHKTLAWRWLLLSLAGLSLLVFTAGTFRQDNLTHVYFLDIGQGDSTLIRTSDHHTILVDGGPNQAVLSRLSDILPPWEHHPDSDHSAGLVSVLENYDVGEVWYNGAEHDTATYHNFQSLLKDKQIPTQIVRAGMHAEWAADTLRVLYPFTDTNIAPLPSNDGGVVTEFTDGNFDLLLTADISDQVESVLVAKAAVNPVEVLKVPHHGSRTSSSAPFLEAVHPDLAVISVGANNRYGHPTQEALDRYKALNIPVLRTDQSGTIQIVTDGSYFKVLD